MNQYLWNRSWKLLSLCLTLLAASLSAQQEAAPVNGDSQAQRLTTLVRVSVFDVAIDGKVDRKVQVFQSPQPKAFLIHSSQLNDAVVLQLDGKKVSALSSQHLNLETDKGQVAEDYSLSDEGVFYLSQASLDFTFQGHDLRLRAKTDLLGFISSQDIRDFDALWAERQRDYEPSQADLNRIRGAANGKKIKVVTYFGSWCPHCQKRVPHLMQVEGQLTDSDVEFSYYGIPRPPAFGQDPEAIEKKIESVPTSVIYQDGKEVGRLIRDDWEKPGESLANLLETL